MPKHKFTNLVNDNQRLNAHTKTCTEELSELIAGWTNHGLDSRAIYSALAIFHDYYFRLGNDELGESYMIALEGQSHNLARIMKERN